LNLNHAGLPVFSLILPVEIVRRIAVGPAVTNQSFMGQVAFSIEAMPRVSTLFFSIIALISSISSSQINREIPQEALSSLGVGTMVTL